LRVRISPASSFQARGLLKDKMFSSDGVILRALYKYDGLVAVLTVVCVVETKERGVREERRRMKV